MQDMPNYSTLTWSSIQYIEQSAAYSRHGWWTSPALCKPRKYLAMYVNGYRIEYKSARLEYGAVIARSHQRRAFYM